MTTPTHITFAEFLYLLLLTTTGVALSASNAFIIAIASTLPDIDTAASYPGRVVPSLSRFLERRFGHRTLTHSVAFMVGLAVLLLPIRLVNADIFVCILAGYSSHPFLDTMTVHGVKLFYPLSSSKCVFPLEVNNPHRYRLQTGSKMDRMLGIFFLLGCIPVFLIAHQGYERFIRSTQKNIESAVRDYNEFSRDNLVFANATAYNMLTKHPFSGTVEVIGALNPSTLIFKGADGDLHTLGKDFEADFVADKILCERGTPVRSTVRSIDLSNQLLSQITAYIDTSVENYLFGDLATTDKVSLPENIRIFSPVTGGGGTVKFSYARYRDILTFNLEYVFITKGILTVKSILPGKNQESQSSPGLTLPRLENYTQISVTLDPKESIQFCKTRGDTVRDKEILARKDLAQFFQDQISLNEGKIQSLESQKLTFLSEVNQKIVNAEQAARIDSTEHAQRTELSKGGFTSDRVLTVSELKWHKSKTTLSQLLASRSATQSRTALEIRKLSLTNRQLRSKANAAEKQSEIHSTVNGLLMDIRQIPHNNKTQVTFIIKRMN
ncbi:MAG: metal-dependent hydrolase [Ignavibacteriales bacterium]|nr:metal-dependent hydrolase [Ignavibacteriales bacterium]